MDDKQKYYKIDRGDTIVELGAYIGYYTLKMAKAVGETGRAITIEPVDRNLKLLRKNIRENHLTNVVTIIPKGAWKDKGKLTLYQGERQDCSMFQEVSSHGIAKEVEVDTVDNMLQGLGINKVDFIVVEINGAEIEALEGMKETLKRTLNLVIAAQYRRFGQPSYKTVLRMLKNEGFNTTVDEEGKVYAWRF